MTHKWKRKAGLWLMALMLCGQAHSENGGKHIIAAGQLVSLFNQPGTLDAEGRPDNGVYHNLLSQILLETGLAAQYEIIVMPMARAKLGFVQGKFACYSPGEDTFDELKPALAQMDYLSSAPINQALVRVVSKPGTPVASRVEDISQQDAIGIIRGGPTNETIKAMMARAGEIYYVDSEEQNIKMLQLSRIRKALIFYPDVIRAYRSLGLERHFPYDPAFAPLVINDNIICHPLHQAAFDKINEKLVEMREDGRLRTLLQEIYFFETLD
ncbi:hypothetical protein P2G88_00440 [Aliiglaciecola sp. CAU 1673]|uniref:hypothetical protein n=1 Tax=Aliiglaciecola sp. CAU 1673 TaxID=3032595 RepID=UPI0023DCD6E1|nr:hypothetical protein [Aliiglaciecola sp. CAU 1673]MDF2176715.1 hypothetical protein [Aliiglaciecola sp. CAU 1673]